MVENIHKTYTLTKKVAKHGNQAVIVIPRFLQSEIKPKSIVEVKLTVIKEEENEIINSRS